ncbi:MAG: hypothetical protein AB1938_13475 [Myxococcota bacterium]
MRTHTLMLMLLSLCSTPALADEWWEREREEREERRERERREELEDERLKEQAERRREVNRQEQQLKAMQRDAARADTRQALRSVPVMKSERPGAKRLWHEGLPQAQVAAIRKLVESNYLIKSLAFTPDGKGFVIIYGKNAVFARGIPESLEKALNEEAARDEEIRSVAFTPRGGWAFVYGHNSVRWNDVSEDFADAARRAHGEGTKIHHVAFSSSGYLIIYGRNYREASGVPRELVTRVDNLSGGLTMLHSVSIRADDTWVASVQGAYSINASDIPPKLDALLSESAKVDRELTLVVLHPRGGWVALAQK